jgi:hypothetical protein
MGVAVGSTGVVAGGLAGGLLGEVADASEVDVGATGAVVAGPAPDPQPDSISRAAKSGVA